jgi:hypothetical protein
MRNGYCANVPALPNQVLNDPPPRLSQPPAYAIKRA